MEKLPSIISLWNDPLFHFCPLSPLHLAEQPNKFFFCSLKRPRRLFVVRSETPATATCYCCMPANSAKEFLISDSAVPVLCGAFCHLCPQPLTYILPVCSAPT